MGGQNPRPQHSDDLPRPGQIAAVTGVYAIAGLTLMPHLAPAVLGYFYLLLGGVINSYCMGILPLALTEPLRNP